METGTCIITNKTTSFRYLGIFAIIIFLLMQNNAYEYIRNIKSP